MTATDMSENQTTQTDPEQTFIVDEATDEVLRLHLDSFHGPFEVLLYLIKAQEIDIFDIPILKVTDQYLQFLDLMHEQNLDVAGEYLVMAATLIQIKSKMILPVEIIEDEEEVEDEDPRMELVEKLIAYRQYRDAASRLETLEEERANWYTRKVTPKLDDLPGDDEDDYIEVSLFDLIQAFKGVLKFLDEDRVHTVETETSSVDEKIERITSLLDQNQTVAWNDLFAECRNKVELVCCFLAILELCRMGAVAAHQHKTFGDIRLYKKTQQQVA